MITVLIAEDDMDLRTIFRDFLQSDFHILEASNGREALEIVFREKPDMLVLDLSMPEVDGWQVAKTIRQSDAMKHLPIIALTAHAMPEDCEKALKVGCDSYLTKPCNLPNLVNEILRLVKAKQVRPK